jgi:hypothetical protein
VIGEEPPAAAQQTIFPAGVSLKNEDGRTHGRFRVRLGAPSRFGEKCRQEHVVCEKYASTIGT